MGISILDKVVDSLKGAGFQAGVAYPGQKYPAITGTVAAVHIEKVDREGMLVTMEVNIICPGAQGGTQCEIEGLRATEILRWLGGECVQNGCSYDGIAQVYCVQILATYNVVSDGRECLFGPGFEVFVDNMPQRYAIGFVAERKSRSELHYVMGETDPVGNTRGWGGWEFTLEERIPAGIVESPDSSTLFSLRVEKRSGFQEVYHNCIWTSARRELTREGIRRIRSGVASSMEEMVIGED